MTQKKKQPTASQEPKKRGRPKLTKEQKEKAAESARRRHAGPPEDKPLSIRERLFVDELKKDPGNASEAARRAGYSSTKVGHTASMLLKKPHIAKVVQVEIGQKLAQLGVDADAVLCRMARIAMTDTSELLRFTRQDIHTPGVVFARPRAQILDDIDWSPGARALFAGIKERTGPDGSVEVEIKTKDQLAALKVMCQHFGVLERANQSKFRPHPEQQQALDDILAGKRTPIEAALWLERNGVPVPDTLMKLVAKAEPVQEKEEDFKIPTAEEMWELRKVRLAEIEAQRQGLDQVRAEVAAIKEELGDKVEQFKPGVMPGGE